MSATSQTILKQLGAGRFIAMTGAKDFVGGDTSLSFRLPTSLVKSRASSMLITLDSSDTYTVELLKWNTRKLEHAVISQRTGVYAETLQAVFTSMTGLETRI